MSNYKQVREQRDELATQLLEAQTEVERLEKANEVLETYAFEFANIEGELRRDLEGANEALLASRAEIARLERELSAERNVAREILERREAANKPRVREEVPLVEASYDEKTHELVVGEFREVVANAVKQGTSIIILGKDGKRTMTIMSGKVPQTAIPGLKTKLVKMPSSEV